MQSALAPAGLAAREIAELTWLLTAGAIAVLIAVIALLLHGALTGPRSASTAAWVVGGGLGVPFATLSLLLAYSTVKTGALDERAAPDAPRVEIDGRQWWWEIRYATDGGPVVAANELRLPVGVPVELVVTAFDVIHAFWVPSLAGKIDMVPGRAHRLTLRADRAGVYRGQCAEYCGAQHAQMALMVVAEPVPVHAAWLREEARPARAAQTEEEARGQAEFIAHGCGGCHAVRGTEALGRLGPDLTHVGTRRTLGAGTLANGENALAAWIGAAHHLKPGNRMPPYGHLPAPVRASIARYLASLR